MCIKSHRAIKQAVAGGWCYPKTENKIMDVDLAEAISLEVDSLFHKLLSQCHETVGLLNSMILSGEEHSDTSKKMVEQTLNEYLNEIAK